MRETSIISGNYALKAFDDDGLIYGAEPIASFLPLAINGLVADANYYFNLLERGHTLQPVSMWIYTDVGQNVTGNSKVIFSVIQGQTIVWEVEIGQTQWTEFGNGINFLFPPLFAEPTWLIKVNANFPANRLVIMSKIIDTQPYFNGVIETAPI